MPNNKIWKKGLVVGIIVLFIGVGIQPAFANEVSITNKTSEVEEDCNCNPVSNLHLIRLERMLNRVESYTNIISIFSYRNPVIKEKFEELSNEITSLREMNNALKSDFLFETDFPIICEIIDQTMRFVGDIGLSMLNLTEKYPILWPILFLPIVAMAAINANLLFWGMHLECDWVPWELPDLLNVVREMNDIKI